MGEDDALAGSRRAAGVEQTGRFVLVHRGVVERRPRRGGDQLVVLAVVDADHAIDEVGERAGVAIGDEDPGAGIGERVCQLGLGPSKVERHLRSPAGRDPAVELDERDRVERQHGDSVAGRVSSSTSTVWRRSSRSRKSSYVSRVSPQTNASRSPATRIARRNGWTNVCMFRASHTVPHRDSSALPRGVTPTAADERQHVLGVAGVDRRLVADDRVGRPGEPAGELVLDP